LVAVFNLLLENHLANNYLALIKESRPTTLDEFSPPMVYNIRGLLKPRERPAKPSGRPCQKYCDRYCKGNVGTKNPCPEEKTSSYLHI